MYTKQEIIIQSYRDGKSQRQISRDLHVNRKTVAKYIEEYESLLAGGVSQETAQCSYLTSVPVYKSAPRSKLRLTTDVQCAIDVLLKLNDEKHRQGLRKQLLKKKDILEELHRQGFEIGYTSVCNYVTNKLCSSRCKEAFIRQLYQPGEVCEFDWGEIKLYFDGKLVRLQLAVFTSAYSNYRYAFIYNRQDTLSFMDSHVRFFKVVGGVYRELVYDNMRVAVSKFVGRHEKEPTACLLQLRGHYGFSHRFCNVYRGNEKGHVERSVEYVRRKVFALKDSFANLEEAESWLFKCLDKINGQKQIGAQKSACEMFSEEAAMLGDLPLSEPVCADQVQLRVDKYATVSYSTNRYSVPDHLVGKFVDVSILSNELRIYHQNDKVALHTRSFEKHGWIVDIEHYLSTFKRKPGALAGSVALASNAYLKHLYQSYFNADSRSFIDLLFYCRENKISQEKLEDSVERLLMIGNGNGHLTSEKLRALLGNKEVVCQKIPEDTICITAREQLSLLSTLMHQTN